MRTTSKKDENAEKQVDCLDFIQAITGGNFFHVTIDAYSKKSMDPETQEALLNDIIVVYHRKPKLLYQMNFAGYTPLCYLLSTEFVDMSFKNLYMNKMLVCGASLFEATKVESARRGFEQLLHLSTLGKVERGFAKYSYKFSHSVLERTIYIASAAQQRALRSGNFPEYLTKVIKTIESGESLKPTDIIPVEIFESVKKQSIKKIDSGSASVISEQSESKAREILMDKKPGAVKAKPSSKYGIFSALSSSLSVKSFFSRTASLDPATDDSPDSKVAALKEVELKTDSNAENSAKVKLKKRNKDNWYYMYSSDKPVIGNEGTCKIADEFFAQEMKVLYDAYNNITCQLPKPNFKELTWMGDLIYYNGRKNSLFPMLATSFYPSLLVYITHRLIKNGLDPVNLDLSCKTKTLSYFLPHIAIGTNIQSFFKALLMFGVDPNVTQAYTIDLLCEAMSLRSIGIFDAKICDDCVTNLIAAGFDVRRSNYHPTHRFDLVDYAELCGLSLKAISMIRNQLYPKGHLDEIKGEKLKFKYKYKYEDLGSNDHFAKFRVIVSAEPIAWDSEAKLKEYIKNLNEGEDKKIDQSIRSKFIEEGIREASDKIIKELSERKNFSFLNRAKINIDQYVMEGQGNSQLLQICVEGEIVRSAHTRERGASMERT